MSITKSIGYAYASSSIATKSGFADTGCWYLSVGDNDGFDMVMVKRASVDKVKVVEWAVKMFPDTAWDFYSMHKQ